MFSNADRKLLQEVQTNRGWEAVEKALEEYLKGIKQDSIKKPTMMDTIWDASFAEGGEYHLKEFFTYLFNEGKKHN